MNRSEFITVQAAKALTMMMKAEEEYQQSECNGDFSRAANMAIDSLVEFAIVFKAFVNDYPYTEKIFDSADDVIKDIEYLKNIRMV